MKLCPIPKQTIFFTKFKKLWLFKKQAILNTVCSSVMKLNGLILAFHPYPRIK